MSRSRTSMMDLLLHDAACALERDCGASGHLGSARGDQDWMLGWRSADDTDARHNVTSDAPVGPRAAD